MSRAIIARHDNYLNTVSDEMCLAELERHINQFRNHSAERLDREIGRYRRGLRCCSEEGRLAYMRKQSEIWAEELRGCRYIRINVGREIKLCFGEKGNDFNKKFVAGVIGVMRNRGYYEGNMKAMSRALEDNRTKQETAYRYMTNGIKGLHIVDGGVRIIDEIVGRRR